MKPPSKKLRGAKGRESERRRWPSFPKAKGSATKQLWYESLQGRRKKDAERGSGEKKTIKIERKNGMKIEI